MTVVFIEDDVRVARGVGRLVTSLGHSMLHARDAREAKRLMAAGGVDLVLADQGLPDGNSGIEFLAWVGEHHPGVRRVLTAGVRPPPGSAPSPAPPDFLAKPFGRAELAALLDG